MKLDSTKTATVDPDYYWRPMSTCPLGSKVQLLNPGGVAAYGKWAGKEDCWRGWAPLPKKPQWMNHDPQRRSAGIAGRDPDPGDSG